MNKNLLKALVCPQCHHAVTHDKSTQQLCCDVCQLAYPIRDDIPVMLVEEATSLTS